MPSTRTIEGETRSRELVMRIALLAEAVGATALLGADGELHPAPFSAFATKVYDSPGVRPLIEHVSTGDDTKQPRPPGLAVTW